MAREDAVEPVKVKIGERRCNLGPRVVTVVKRRMPRDSYLIPLNETAITFKF